MNTQEKIKQLRRIIDKQIRPLISSDYVYLDLPYYSNIGDTLIWAGTSNFFKTVPFKCLHSYGLSTYFPFSLSSSTVILLQGGGNLGDLYRVHSDFRRKIISTYPNNKVIILPQTVFYEHDDFIKEDAAFYAKYPNVTICAREQYSYDFLKAHFHNDVLLVPDMAFYLDVPTFDYKGDGNRILFLKRTDKELVDDQWPSFVPENAEVHDWPTYEHRFLIDRIYWRLQAFTHKFCSKRMSNRFTDYFREYWYKPFYIRKGVELLKPYSSIYTTRLHVMILGLLMNKRLYLINNSSGKLVNYYNTWLKDLDTITVLEQ